MRILLLGASGLIGASTAARLRHEGHEVVGVRRRRSTASDRVAVDAWIDLDLRDADRPEAWFPLLGGIEAVVNCAGVLQDNARDSTRLVHDLAPAALWQACAQAGIRRIVQISALGADRGLTDFSETKGKGDGALMASDLDWVIVRPSVVVGRAAYGGSALIRSLASLPLIPVLPGAGPIDIVQLDDVVETVARMLAPGAPSQVVLELAGPDRLSFSDIVGRYRRWLGWPPARELKLPAPVFAAAWRAGDLVARLGWRPPIRTTARRELVRGAIGDNRDWIRLTGIRPKSLDQALEANPASAQDRWFARLYLLKPLVFAAFAGFWILTGLISLGPGWSEGVALLRMTPASSLAEPLVFGGGLIDIAVGAAILYRPTARAALIAALGVSLVYLAAGTLLLPYLWADPLGRMLKLLPILILNLICLAILDER